MFVIGPTFGIRDYLTSQRVNPSLDLGRIVRFDLVILHTKFQLSTTPESAIKALDFELSFRFPPPQEIGLNVGRGGEVKEAYFLAFEKPSYQILAAY